VSLPPEMPGGLRAVPDGLPGALTPQRNARNALPSLSGETGMIS
jgi:hypothetical protein